MDPLRPFSEPPPESNPGGRNSPFTVHFHSASPVLGCLFALGALVIGGLLALGAGIAVLLAPLGLLAWRLVRKLLPASPPAASPPVSDYADDYVSHGVIDVESTLLPPESDSQLPTENEQRKT